MAKGVRKKVFLTVFCLASIVQGMYSTYFVSILTTIERIYQIQSKTAGAILSATEMGQILGSLLIAYYGGRGNKPKWIAACMTLTAIAALISTLPHFFLKSATRHTTILVTPVTDYHQPGADLSQWRNTSSEDGHLFGRTLPGQLCNEPTFESQLSLSPTSSPPSNLSNINYSNLNLNLPRESSTGPALVIFFICLLIIGFGSTAITTLGIPFIDDIVSKEESPLYLGLTICLKIFGPALGFILGSICIQLNIDMNQISGQRVFEHSAAANQTLGRIHGSNFGAWWLGIIIISLPLLVLAIPMYLLSKSSARHMIRAKRRRESQEDFADVTYQAAEDHDIVDSKDFEPHVLTIADLDVTSNGTCYSDVDTSSREVLQGKSHAPRFRYANFSRNILLKQPTIRTSGDSKSVGERQLALLPKMMDTNEMDSNNWTTTNYLIVDHFGGLQSTSLSQEEAKRLCLNYCSSSASSSSSMSLQQPKPEPRPPPSTSSSSDSYKSSSSSLDQSGSNSTSSITSKLAKAGVSLSSSNMGSSLMRLLGNRLMVLRMLSGILHILSIAGFYTFLPKYLMEQFRLAPSSASAISGLAGILFVGIGAFLGGTLIRVFNVNSRIMTRWIALSSLLYAMGMIIMMQLGCPENQLVHYGSQAQARACHLDVKFVGCHCSSNIFDPVCLDGRTYLSPCLAGCHNYSTNSEGDLVYQDCGCPLSTDGSRPTQSTGTDSTSSLKPSFVSDEATRGYCPLSCSNMIWYIVVFSTFTLIHASCEVGSVMFNLRCVSSNDRTLALGLITFTSSLFGTIPCSIIYGSVIDYTCVHWDSSLTLGLEGVSVEQRGACQAYENKSFREYLHGLTALVMLMAFVVDCATCYCAREVNFYDESHQTPVVVSQPKSRLNDSHSEEKMVSHCGGDDQTITVQDLDKPAETI